MTDSLRALVLGSGFAGQGHAMALRDSGVEIAGMVSRTAHVLEEVAAEMGIPYAGTDVSAALRELQPDVVAVGTPGGAHVEPILAALEHGCHIFCDKPLAAYANEAKTLYQRAQERGVKTAFAASFRYQPCALLARELVADGAIGEPQEVECISHYNLNPLIPFGWSHRIDAGGGRLNNNFSHKLSIVLNVLDGAVTAVNGEVRNDMGRAPVVTGVHDFRTRAEFAPADPDEPGLEWRTVDAEWTYTVLARVASALSERPVSALFKHSGLQPRFARDYVAFYGSEGAIYIEGAYAQGPLYVCVNKKEWEEVPVLARIAESLPEIADDTQRNWTQLAREFVADIRGEDAPPYQTFRDGWIFQEVIDAVRAGAGWVDVPDARTYAR